MKLSFCFIISLIILIYFLKTRKVKNEKFTLNIHEQLPKYFINEDDKTNLSKVYNILNCNRSYGYYQCLNKHKLIRDEPIEPPKRNRFYVNYRKFNKERHLLPQ